MLVKKKKFYILKNQDSYSAVDRLEDTICLGIYFQLFEISSTSGLGLDYSI